MFRFGVAVIVVLCAASAGECAINVASSGPGNLATTPYEGQVTFTQIGFTDQGTITQWNISGLAPVVSTVTYAQSDLDFTGAFNSGFRWAEIVNNTSGVAWWGFEISLTNTSATFSGLGDFLNVGIGTEEVPGFADINLVPTPKTIVVRSDLGQPIAPEGWVMFLSPDRKTITMNFAANPILPGQSFEVHVPIVNLGNGGGSFELTQIASVPEPASVTMFSMLGIATIAGAARRRSGAAKA